MSYLNIETPKYFAFIDGEQKGPFSLQQLTDVGVRPSTYVWCKGMDDWHRADSVAEITDYLRGHISTSATRQQTVIPADTPHPGIGNGYERPEKSESEKPERVGFPFRETEEAEPDLSAPPQVSMALAVIAAVFCFIPTGIAAIIFTHKSLKLWKEAQGSPDTENLRRQAKEYERQAKMWLGLTVAFGLIFWTVIFSIV